MLDFRLSWASMLFNGVNPYTQAFLKSLASQAVGWIAHKAVSRSAHSCKRWMPSKVLAPFITPTHPH
jgi:hypothetical protein